MPRRIKRNKEITLINFFHKSIWKLIDVMLFRLRENFAECKGRNKNINENMIQKRKPSKDKKRQKKGWIQGSPRFEFAHVYT